MLKRSASLLNQTPCQQAFSKPGLVNLISKDTHLVFSIYRNPEPNNFNNSVLPFALMPRIKFHLNLNYGSGGVAENVKS